MKKLLNSDWLRAVQFKCNTVQKSVHDWLKDNRNFSKKIISRKMMTKILCWNFEKSFLKWEKIVSRKIFRHFLRANFSMFILLISNHMVFLVQFGVNLHLWVFQKAHSCKLIPNWTQNHMITYTNTTLVKFIQNHIQDSSGVFSISSLVKISMISLISSLSLTLYLNLLVYYRNIFRSS